MVQLYNFFRLVFILQKKHKQQQQNFFEKKQQSLASKPQASSLLPLNDITPGISSLSHFCSFASSVPLTEPSEFLYPSHTKDAILVFDIQPFLRHLSLKPSYLLFQCLDALRAIDIEKYKKNNLANALHTYYMKAGHQVATQEDWRYLKSYLRHLNKSTLAQVVVGAASPYQEQIVQLDKKNKLKEYEYKNKIQNFFNYIDNNYGQEIEANFNPNTGELEPESALSYGLKEVKYFFKEQEYQIQTAEDLNQNSLHSINYFGSFLKKLLENKSVGGVYVIEFMTSVFKNKEKAIDFLLSISGSSLEVSVLKGLEKEQAVDVERLEVFERLDTRQLGKVGLYHFARNYNLVLAHQTPLDVLYIFDKLTLLTDAIDYRSQKALAVPSTQVLLQLLNTLRPYAQITNLENPKFIELENIILSEQLQRVRPLVEETKIKVIKI